MVVWRLADGGTELKLSRNLELTFAGAAPAPRIVILLHLEESSTQRAPATFVFLGSSPLFYFSARARDRNADSEVSSINMSYSI